ncbi:phage integrase family protein, partial [groundwater metagenome]
MTGIKIGRGVANRITVSFSYNPDYIAKIKTIEGYRWHPEEKCWSLPSGNDILDRLASLFEGERLNIDPSLQTIADRANPMRDFDDIQRELISRKYSPKTIKAYIHYNEDFLRFAKK